MSQRIKWEAHMKNRGRRALLFQALAVILFTLLSVLAVGLGGIWYDVGMWGLVPLAGAVCAWRGVRRGVSAYLAWILPPCCQTAFHWILLGYPPGSPGMPMVCALLALVASAAAQVLNERENKPPQEKRDRIGGR